MKKIFPVIIAAIFFAACSQPGKNDKVAKKTIDEKWLDSVIKKTDTSYTRSYKRADFATTAFYLDREDSSVCQLMKDSTGMIRQVIIAKKNTRTFFAQYYANGQQQADLPLDEFGQYHGSAVYYYESGIAESRGAYRHGLKNGEWNNYDSRGNIISVEEYDQDGRVVKKKDN
jgi:hypothetical protein